MLVVRAVRKVDPEDVDARLHQFLEDVRLARGRTDRRHDLGPHLASLFSMFQCGLSREALVQSFVHPGIPARRPTR